MEAYLFKRNSETSTLAMPDKDPLDIPEYADWVRSEKSALRIPESITSQWTNKAEVIEGPCPPSDWVGAAGYCVTPEIVEIIEGLEPKIHQYFSIDIHCQGEIYKYFMLQINQSIEDVDVEASDVRWDETSSGRKYWMKRTSTPLVLPRCSVEGHHMWWNKRAQMTVMSGELRTALLDAKATAGLTFQEQIVA